MFISNFLVSVKAVIKMRDFTKASLEMSTEEKFGKGVAAPPPSTLRKS